MGVKRSMSRFMMGLAVSGIVLSTGLTGCAAPANAGGKGAVGNLMRNNHIKAVTMSETGEVEVVFDRDALRELIARKQAQMREAGILSDSMSVYLDDDSANKETSGKTSTVGKETEGTKVEAGMGTAVGYTFTEMKETMYAKSQVNVRSLPSTDGEKVGKLTSGQEVKVTGQCAETGWYRIAFEDGTAYVSDGYIISEKPSTQTANRGVGYSASENAERERVLAAANGGSSGSAQDTAGGVGQQSQESSTSSGLSVEFVNYLNQQRAAAGLQQISWDDNLAAEAQRRAQEIVTNFSHDGSGNYLENILYGGSGSASDWYTQWYNSEGHRLTMFQEYLSAGGCAFYQVDGIYYVVFTAKVDIPAQSAEEWNETKNDPNSGYHQMESTENGDGWNSYGNEGVSVLTEDDEMYEEVSSWDWGS